MLVGATDLARRVAESDGEAPVDDMMLFGLARGLTEAPFPSEELSARLAGEVFLTAFRALRTAGRPQRKVILAALVAASAQAVDDVFADEVSVTTEVWRKRLGASE